MSNIPGSMSQAILGGAKSPKSNGRPGGIRLNVNVGASTIETANKFKQKDLELQKQNHSSEKKLEKEDAPKEHSKDNIE